MGRTLKSSGGQQHLLVPMTFGNTTFYSGQSEISKIGIYEPVSKFKLGLVTSFDKLRTNGGSIFAHGEHHFPLVVSHFGKLRTGLSNHEARYNRILTNILPSL
jgi:hypothetical protein